MRNPGSLALLTNGSWSYPIWQEIRARETELLDGTFAWSNQRFDLSPSGQSDPVDGAYVSGRFFEVRWTRAAALTIETCRIPWLH